MRSIVVVKLLLLLLVVVVVLSEVYFELDSGLAEPMTTGACSEIYTFMFHGGQLYFYHRAYYESGLALFYSRIQPRNVGPQR